MTDSPPDACSNEVSWLYQDVFEGDATERGPEEVSEEARFYYLQILSEIEDRLKEITELVRQGNLRFAATCLDSLLIDLNLQKRELGAILLRVAKQS